MRLASLIATAALAYFAIRGALQRPPRRAVADVPRIPSTLVAFRTSAVEVAWPGIHPEDAARVAMAWPVNWPEVSTRYVQ